MAKLVAPVALEEQQIASPAKEVRQPAQRRLKSPHVDFQRYSYGNRNRNGNEAKASAKGSVASGGKAPSVPL